VKLKHKMISPIKLLTYEELDDKFLIGHILKDVVFSSNLTPENYRKNGICYKTLYVTFEFIDPNEEKV